MSSAWDTFIKTGNVNDYLIYKCDENALFGKTQFQGISKCDDTDNTIVYEPDNTGVDRYDKYSRNCNP